MSMSRFGETILDMQALRIEVRTDAGPGPVLVDNVSLTLRKGEVLGLIGESGAGKSTIGLAALGYTRGNCFMTGGKVLFHDKDIRQMSISERALIRGRGVAYIAQSAAASFNPAMTLYQQICEIPVLQGLMSMEAAKAEAVVLFRKLELPHPETFGERYPHQVSGGQLQRAMAAMAMITKPDLLLADEPTGNLDGELSLKFMYLFEALNQAGTTVLIATHDEHLISLFDYPVLRLKEGKLTNKD